MNIQLTAELDFLDDGTGHGNVLINHHLNIHNSPLGFREEGRKRISFTGNNCQMCFLIDSTTITLTHSIFHKLYSSFSLRSLNLNCHLSLFWVAQYFSVCQLQYFSAHLKFAPIRGLHLHGKLSRYKPEVIIWKISPFHKFPGRGCCPTKIKNLCCNNWNLLCHQKMHKINDGFYDDVKHIMKSAEMAQQVYFTI